ncbi:MAG: sugar-binding protein [Bacteroidota bacterium]
MKNRIATLLFLFICLTGMAIAQEASDRSRLIIESISGPTPWSNLDLNNSKDQFQFAIVTDRTGGVRPGVFPKAIQKLNLLQPEFVMSVGDLIQGYTEDTVELNRQWREFIGFIDNLSVPFFYVPGNHDMTNKVMYDLWMEKFGRDYYHFVYKDVLFLCLNSEDQYRGASKGTIGDQQFEWVKKTLAANAGVKHTLVFLHQPLWLQEEETLNWPAVEKLLKNRPHTVFCGHRHHYVKYERNNGNYFMLATTGGGSGLRGTTFGEFDHVVWVTMTSEGPIIANLLLQGIWDENVNTAEQVAHVDSLLGRNPVTFEPLLVDGPDFEEGTIPFKITNDEDVPLTVRLAEHFSWDLNGKFDRNEITIGPNSVEKVNLQLATRKKRVLDKLRPFRTSIHLSAAADGFDELEVPMTLNVKPIQRQVISEITRKVKVDGKLKEWDELPMQVVHEASAEDLQVNFQVAYDDEFVYFAAKVQDDTLNKDTTTAVWRQDNLAWVVDAHPMSTSLLNKGRSYYRDELAIRMSPSTATLPTQTYHPERIPEGALRSYVATENGYNVEIAIPRAVLEEQQGGELRHLRFNVIVDDYDSRQNGNTRLSLYPDWWKDESFAGSGLVFLK